MSVVRGVRCEARAARTGREGPVSWPPRRYTWPCSSCSIPSWYGTMNTVKPVLGSHPWEAQKGRWLLNRGETKLKFGNILFGSLIQVGCFIEVTANLGLTVINI